MANKERLYLAKPDKVIGLSEFEKVGGVGTVEGRRRKRRGRHNGERKKALDLDSGMIGEKKRLTLAREKRTLGRS